LFILKGGFLLEENPVFNRTKTGQLLEKNEIWEKTGLLNY